MKLVIAEKDMLARDIARAICGVEVGEKTRLPIQGNGYTVCAASGHLLELVPPEEYDSRCALKGDWTIDDLPIAFHNWNKYVKRARGADGKKLSKEDDFASRKLAIISELLTQADEVIAAGDPDDEGQYLIDEILDYCGWQGSTKRVYVNDNIAKNIIRAFDNLKNNDDCRCNGNAAYARSMADFCFGINESRLLVQRTHHFGLSLGRVQTPTLGLVVARDSAIANHTVRQFYELTMMGTSVPSFSDLPFLFKPSQEYLDGEDKVYDASRLETLSSKLDGTEIVATAKNGTKMEYPELPYNLTELTADMSKRYGFSAKQVLEITQSLRDKFSAITYNRTDCRYLKLEHFEQAPVVLPIVMANIGLDWTVNTTLKSKAFNDKNITAHHGIIPQEISLDCTKMSENELRVYQAIVERYAMQFLPPCSYDTCELAASIMEGSLVYVAKRVRELGFRAFVKTKPGTEEDVVPVFVEDGEYSVTLAQGDIVSKETHPPKPYTEGTLIKDMSSVAKYVTDPNFKKILETKDKDSKSEHGSIGTTATRPAIIETLKRRGYLTVEKGKIHSTELGREVYAIVPDNIKGADMTARWWLVQEDIRMGKRDVNALLDDVCKVFCEHKETAYRGVTLAHAGANVETFGKCPICGEPLIATKKMFRCSSNHYKKHDDGSFEQTSGCGWDMWNSIASKKLTCKQVERLLAGEVVQIKGMKSKAGKSFDAGVKCPDPSTGKLEFVFDNKKKNH